METNNAMSKTDAVTQEKKQIPDLISWMLGKGEEEIRRIVREHLADVHDAVETAKKSAGVNVPWWDDIITPNDDRSQWRQGGDCTVCGKRKYCKTQCRANRMLKRATSPFLYQEYLAEYPEAEALIAAKKLTPEQLLKMLGIEP